MLGEVLKMQDMGTKIPSTTLLFVSRLAKQQTWIVRLTFSVFVTIDMSSSRSLFKSPILVQLYMY